MKNDELLHKWINNTISDEELEIFKQREEFDALVDLYEHTNDLSTPQFDPNKMLDQILSSQKTSKIGIKGKSIIPVWARYGIAASILVVFTWFLFNNSHIVSYEMGISEKLSQSLPDGSQFALNAKSKLSYDKKKWFEKRTISLEGEAYFEVIKGKPFLVQTTLGNIEVLGTKFNIRSRKNRLDVICDEGRVRVKTTKDEIVLDPGEAMSFIESKGLEKWESVNSNSKEWMEGVTRLRKVNLKQVIDELERQYGVQFEYTGINPTAIVSCNFQHDNIDLALKTALAPFDLDYRKTGDKILLSK